MCHGNSGRPIPAGADVHPDGHHVADGDYVADPDRDTGPDGNRNHGNHAHRYADADPDADELHPLYPVEGCL
jgi:hypothetical protein